MLDSQEKLIWNTLYNLIGNEHGTAGLMGNLYAESGLMSCNLENTYNKSLNLSDEEYTKAVDAGTYKNFVYDKAGYGLAQWTWWSRKKALYDYAKSKNKSVGDLQMQLEFLVKELKESYCGVLETLKNAASVMEASNKVLFDFERPANMDVSVQRKRGEYGQVYYDRYTNSQKGVDNMSNSPLVDYTLISPNKTSPRNHAIDTITIHCVVGQSTVETLGNIFASPMRQASSNYGIGFDGRIGMYVEEKDRSWCSSSYENDNRAITIEVASDTTHPYAVTDKAYTALIELVTDICRRNNIKKLVWSNSKNDRINHRNGCNMTVHRDYANKSCPGDYLYKRHGEIATEVNRRLNNEIIQMEDDTMTSTEFKKLYMEMRKELQDNDAGEWSQIGRDFCIQKGLMVGSGTTADGSPNYMWDDFLTRQQMAVLLYRFYELIKREA